VCYVRVGICCSAVNFLCTSRSDGGEVLWLFRLKGQCLEPVFVFAVYVILGTLL